MTRRVKRQALWGRRRGFTLVELVIVGALIALFSGLAVFGVQQQYRSNIRKATIAECRNIASALLFANLDTTVFPKLCWITESRESLDFLADQVLPTGQQLGVYQTMDVSMRTGNVAYGTAVRNSWQGPYFAMSQARGGFAQGRGGFVNILLPDLGTSQGPNNVSEPGGLRWPADPYNNPYVVYMLDIDQPRNPSGQPIGTPTLRFVGDTGSATAPQVEPTRKGNFVNAVVSYGPNHTPGGEDFEVEDFGPRPTDDGAVQTAGNGMWNMRLYLGVQDFTPSAKGIATYTLRPQGQLTAARANVWARDFATANGAPLPASGIGISDIGSDDIVFEF